MAILANFKEKMTTGLVRSADAGANIVAKASGLSSEQLRDIELRRQRFMSEKPETDPEGIKRLLGGYAIEAYDAYLPQISRLYDPLELEIDNDEKDLINRIRYFEISKWVSDSSEDSLEKLISVYEVISRERCNVALIYNRKKEECSVYLAIISTDPEDKPQTASTLEDRLIAAIKGNFPGVEIKQREKNSRQKNLFGIGMLDCLKNTEGYSVAAVSNIATEKTQDFSTQRMEKLLDGICPKDESEEYTIVLLATPVTEQLERKNKLSELYSKLAPYAGWQTNFTYNEMYAEGSHAAVGVNLGASAGKRSAKEELHTQGDSSEERTAVTREEIRDEYEKKYKQTLKKFETSLSAKIEASLRRCVKAGVDIGILSEQIEAEIKAEIKAEMKGVIEKDNVRQKGEDNHSISKEGRIQSNSNNVNNLYQTGKRGIDLGVNFGLNFSRSSDVSVTIGKNEGLTQTFTNYGIKYMLETIEKQIKRLEESSALGMWDFSAYFLSKDPVIVNNSAHMYLALTQGNESYLSQSSVNLWVPPINSSSKDMEKNKRIQHRKQSVKNIIEYIKRLQHPEFQLREEDSEGNLLDDEWLMYPPHINATVSLTGRELARSLNFPQKSISGMPIIECASFGREVHKYEFEDNLTRKINLGHVYHMHHEEEEYIKLDIDSLTSHTFITGSTGTGKSNVVYQLLSKVNNNKIPFLVIEPAKGEYKECLGEDCHVFGTNRTETELLYINPFSFPEKIHILEHIDRLVEILNACWPMYAAMPAVLKDSIERVYVNKGWNLLNSKCCVKGRPFPTFADLLITLPEVMEESSYSADTKNDYSGALMTRVKSLTNGLNGQLLCSGIEIDEKTLFEENTIIDLSRIGSMETKSLFMGILVMKLQEYHMSRKQEMNGELRHLTILEEAHNLLRRTSVDQSQESSNLQGKSVEMITNSIAEMRTYGEGFVIVDQAPGLLDEAVIRNTNTKIILRLPYSEDRELVGKAVALNDDQTKEIAKLPRGVAVLYQNDWLEAVLCHFDKYEDKKPYVRGVEQKQLPQELFYKHIFTEEGFKTLREEDVDSVLAWVENSKYARETKRILKKAVKDYTLTEEEKQLIAYNLFEGKSVAKLLSSALTEKEGLENADYFIQMNTDIADGKVIEFIRQMIIQVIVSQNEETDLAKRYVEYSEKIR